jgi:RHS repeat-associated protein
VRGQKQQRPQPYPHLRQPRAHHHQRHPNADSAIAFTGTRALSYAFDDLKTNSQTINGSTKVGNGNLEYTVSQDTTNSRHNVRYESYTSFAMPLQITLQTLSSGALTTTGTGSCATGVVFVGTNQCLQTAALPMADRTLSFVYGPEHQRIKQNITLTSNGTTEHKHYLKAAGMTFALFTSRTGNLNGLPATSTSYFHHDQLGSISAITNELSAVTERLAYDLWGKRRFINTTPGATDKLDAIVGLRTDRGFTEHEHLDEMGVVHMNGRINDPLIGRFMSADPFIQALENLQSYNRYAYVMNNPLTLTDPSGYFSLRKVFRAVVVIAVAYYTGQWIGEALISSATSGFIAGTSGLSTGLVTLGGQAGVLTGLGSAIAGAAGGFAAGVLSSGTLEGGLQGALTGGAFGFVGGTWAAGTPGNYAGHAVVGCVSSVAGGGQCGSGAASAVFGKYVTNATSSLGAGVAHFTATVVAGGVGSVIAGGKFENGAKTAAFGYLYNQMNWKSMFATAYRGQDYSDQQLGADLGKAAKDGVKEAGRATLKFATSDVMDIGGVVLGNTLPGKVVFGVGLAADGIDLYVYGNSAGLAGTGAGFVLQRVSPAFRAMPEWASSRAASGAAYGIEKGVENTYGKQ